MRAVVIAGLVLGLSVSAQAAKNTALITQVSGHVTYKLPIPESEAVASRPFQRARKGDQYEVPDGASIRLVYTQSGRQELWHGPAVFAVGLLSSKVVSGDPPKVKQLPTGNAKALGRVSSLLRASGLAKYGAPVSVRGRHDPDATHVLISGGGADGEPQTLGSGGRSARHARWRAASQLSTAEKNELKATLHQYEMQSKLLGNNDPTADYILVGTLSHLRVRAELVRALKRASKRFPNEATFGD